jgi:hypothetical protein
MRHIPRTPALLGAALFCAIGGAIACAADATDSPLRAADAARNAAVIPIGVQKELKEVHDATARFATPAAAIAGNWKDSVTNCMTDPVQGGMGVHYADVSRFDATVQPTRPELLVYEPQNGVLKLVAVEYAIPLTAWTKSQPPTLLGQRFHVNTQFGLWVLHAWVHKPNPSGVFNDWNPNVTCPEGTASMAMEH